MREHMFLQVILHPGPFPAHRGRVIPVAEAVAIVGLRPVADIPEVEAMAAVIMAAALPKEVITAAAADLPEAATIPARDVIIRNFRKEVLICFPLII